MRIMVFVVDDSEIKTPVLVDASLPKVFGLVVFLGAQGRVPEILEQEQDCLSKAA